MRCREAARSETQPADPCPAEEREVQDVVLERLSRLPERQRNVMMLKVQEGKSYREISELTGISPSNIGYLIHTGLKALAHDLRLAGVV